MGKFETLTVVIAGILVAASIANAVLFPIPSGPIRACPFWHDLGGHLEVASWSVSITGQLTMEPTPGRAGTSFV
jgi:hypothetical protein